MSQQSFEEMYRANQWLVTVQAQQSFALTMSRGCSSDFADLILSETRKNTEQEVPRTPDELALRQRQAAALTLKISTIAYANSMTNAAAGAAAQILQATRDYCAAALPKTDADFQHGEHAAADFTANISKLCFATWSPQI